MQPVALSWFYFGTGLAAPVQGLFLFFLVSLRLVFIDGFEWVGEYFYMPSKTSQQPK